MDLLTPVVTGSLLTLFTGLQFWINRGHFEAIDRGFERLETELARVRDEIAGLRSDILKVALAVTGRGE